MCYEEKILQQIIDNTYEGDLDEVLKHINSCSICKERYNALSHQDELIKNLLNKDLEIPSRPIINIEKRRKINMNKNMKKWTAVAAGLVVCAGLVFAEPVRVMAEDFLKIFRVQEVKTVAISLKDIREIEALFEKGKGELKIGEIGNISVTSQEEVLPGLDNPTEDTIKKELKIDNIIKLPKNFKYEYVNKIPASNLNMKLDVDKANDLLAYLGEDIKLPKTLDNKNFAISFEDSMSYTMNKQEQNNKNRMETYIQVVQMKKPEIKMPKDVDEKDLINTLITMKILPENLKRQFAAIDKLESTLVIPYNPESQIKKDISINGQTAVLIKNNEESDYHISIFFNYEGNTYIINSDYEEKEVIQAIEEMF
ncbi:MAG: hypothetical protein N4A48_05065 [Tepidibacter sp.]|jgi:hypothetical protein|uniref:anti-sigma factor family protein n=1 Tax=Tepidibacter sp. TaxID=2529387 RepID=UPI0025E1EACC|nr:hypothetical protein [Tepidibacter sp.]MCT4508123.1 hypothetical protein [Tepidibacter sp.]